MKVKSNSCNVKIISPTNKRNHQELIVHDVCIAIHDHDTAYRGISVFIFIERGEGDCAFESRKKLETEILFSDCCLKDSNLQ